MPKGHPLTEEQILQKLRRVRRAVARGARISAVREMLGISQTSYSRWNQRYGHLLDAPARKPAASARERTVKGRRK